VSSLALTSGSTRMFVAPSVFHERNGARRLSLTVTCAAPRLRFPTHNHGLGADWVINTDQSRPTLCAFLRARPRDKLAPRLDVLFKLVEIGVEH
jgi:hypothetical protein